MLTVFVVCSSFFMLKLGAGEGLILSAGAFFTFGASTNHLRVLCLPFRILYVGEAFIGISLIALFITVLARRWFADR